MAPGCSGHLVKISLSWKFHVSVSKNEKLLNDGTICSTWICDLYTINCQSRSIHLLLTKYQWSQNFIKKCIKMFTKFNSIGHIKFELSKVSSSYHLCFKCFSQLSFDSECALYCVGVHCAPPICQKSV